MSNNPTIRWRGLLTAALCALALVVSLRGSSPVAASFPGINGLIAFVSDRDGDDDIYVMESDGSNLVNLTNNTAGDRGPTWSSDGTRIAFHSNRDGNYDLYVMNADGSNVTNVTNAAGNDYSPTWSPDGTKIAFVSDRTGNQEIFVVNIDGTNQVNLTNHGHPDYFPSWSPDGSKIAFSSTRAGNDEIYVMNPDGSGLTRLTYNPQWEYDPNWSPDGTKIAFIGSPSGNHELYLMNADGSGQVNLSNTPTNEQGPAWSPDGTQLALLSMADGDMEIWVRPMVGGGDPVQLTFDPKLDFEPDWQPQPPSPPDPEPDIYVSALATGMTADGLAYGPHDILLWDGDVWSKWFDGTAAGLTPNGKAKHNIAAMHVPAAPDEALVVAFAQNARFVPGISGKVNGMDLVRWDGAKWSLWFDGEDVGLTQLTHEKIDALHVLPGAMSPFAFPCEAYLLISTQGPGAIPAAPDQLPFTFGGEDVLGFCLLTPGPDTTGVWHKLLDGRDEGLRPNALTSLSVSPDLMTLYLTTRATFNVDGVTGGHSMIYTFDWATGTFSGPDFIAADAGLPGKVDALHVTVD